MDKGGGGAAPTGCYKCGRPGHWSRDCPSNPNQNPNPNPNSSSSNYPPKPSSSAFNSTGNETVGGGSKSLQKPTEKPKKVPRSRPKLTPDLLLSNDGIGYVLRHFPKAFKNRGRGHEFVHKVEQVGATRRVKVCLGGLRDRVANGGDPTKLHELPAEHNVSNADEATNVEEPCHVQQDTSLKNRDTDDFREDMLQEIYDQGTEKLSPALHSEAVTTDHLSSRHSSMEDLSYQANETRDSITREIHVSEDQKARMEANRLKALEKAAARARSLQTA